MGNAITRLLDKVTGNDKAKAAYEESSRKYEESQGRAPAKAEAQTSGTGGALKEYGKGIPSSTDKALKDAGVYADGGMIGCHGDHHYGKRK